MISWYQNIPLKIDPIALEVGSFSLRWYSLSYIVGFLIVYLLLILRIKKGEFFLKDKEEAKDIIFEFIVFSAVGSLLGGRIGYFIFYNFDIFLSNPITIFYPYNENGEFIGFFGMSYYGALIGILLAGYFFCKKNELSFFRFADFIVPAVPAGYFFGRIGNFLNGELFGRVTESFWGMRFFADPENLRFPSQILEAFFEGIILFVFLWSIRNNKIFEKRMLFLYIFGYSLFRFFLEFLREPDDNLGIVFFGLTMGQILAFFAALISLFYLFKKKKNSAIISLS